MKKLLTIMFAALAVIACSTDDQYDINYFTQKYKQTEKPSSFGISPQQRFLSLTHYMFPLPITVPRLRCQVT